MKLALFVGEQARGCEDEFARLLAETLAVPVVALAGAAPLPDEASYAAARAAWEGLEEDARPLIAGSVLAAFAPFASELAARNAVALVHEPLALLTDERGEREPPEQEGIAHAQPFGSGFLLSRAIQTSGDSASDHRALAAVLPQVLGLVPRVIASSDAVTDAIVTGAAVPRARIAVVAPPTPVLPRARGSDGPGVAILAKGPLAPESAHEVLLEALAGLPDLAWRLSIAGCAANPDYAADLARLAGQLGIASRVHFARDVDAAEMEMLWERADVFALAAAGPGYRIATAAALKCGLPVVICGDAGTVPAIPAEAGAIAPPGDRAQLVKALRRLVFDRELRREMADAAWEAGRTLPDARGSGERFAEALENAHPT